jgi:hypothetical protein
VGGAEHADAIGEETAPKALGGEETTSKAWGGEETGAGCVAWGVRAGAGCVTRGARTGYRERECGLRNGTQRRNNKAGDAMLRAKRRKGPMTEEGNDPQRYIIIRRMSALYCGCLM